MPTELKDILSDSRYSNAMERASERDWSRLPSDMVSLIRSLLSGRDRIIFNCVCKAWKSVYNTTLPSSAMSSIRLIDPLDTLSKVIQFPLLMFVGRDSSVWNFYHAIDNITYTLDHLEIANATIRYAKNGWLLMSGIDKEVFFFNPITKERIELPPIESPSYCFDSIAFSTIPTSPDCVVVAIDVSYKYRTLNLSYICKGENNWTCLELTHKNVDFVPSYCNPIFHKGIFYCLGTEGNLVTFDPKKEGENAFNVFSRPNKPCTSSQRIYFIENEVELLSIFEGRAGEFIMIFKLNESSMSWKKVTNLGEDFLFVSLTSSLSVACKEAQAMGLRNTIFFPRFRDKQHVVFYSHLTGKFHCLTLDNSSSKNYFGTAEKLHCCWIQPNFERHSEEELQWHSE